MPCLYKDYTSKQEVDAVSENLLGNSSVELPVSNTTLRFCGGVPTIDMLNTWTTMTRIKTIYL